jgi:hypothetical protein
MRGRPFQRGEDERRNLNGRAPGPTLPPTLRRQAREDRAATFKRLAELRDQGKDLRIALEASKVLAQYADGKPREAELYPEEEKEEIRLEEEIEALIDLVLPPDASPEERAAARERLRLQDDMDLNPPALDDLALPGANSPE